MTAKIDVAQDLNTLESIYRERWQKHGFSPLSLGWTKGKQNIRFSMLLDTFEISGKSFLDVGCGFGDINLALSARGDSYDYLGIDMVEEFLGEGRERYQGDRISFRKGDFLTMPLDARFDYIVASGIFAHRLDQADNYDYIEAMLRKMMDHADEAVSVDFLSDRVNFQREGTFYANPGRILDIALGLSRNVRLRHDYMPFEFTLTIHSDDSFEDADTIFARYKNAG